MLHSGSVGAVAPSSKHLAGLIVERAGVGEAASILELGPGEGAFTRVILSRRKADARFVAVEKSGAFVNHLRRHYPDTPVLHGCATGLSRHLRSNGFGPVDCVVSGLPWALLPMRVQARILREVAAVLAPGGTFSTFAYFGPHWLPAGRRFRGMLERRFAAVQTSRIELRNLPPAFVYTARGHGGPGS